MLLVTRDGVFGDAELELYRLQSLCSDLAAIANGYRPEKELMNAPFLDDFGPSFRWEPCLTGNVQGHPIVRGPAIQTSGLWAYSPDLGFARTLSRYYRLGQPLAKAGGVQ